MVAKLRHMRTMNVEHRQQGHCSSTVGRKLLKGAFLFFTTFMLKQFKLWKPISKVLWHANGICGPKLADELTQHRCVLWCIQLACNQLLSNSLGACMSPSPGDTLATSIYRIVASRSMSWLVTCLGLFRLLMKVIFGPYVLWPLDKKLIFWT